MPLSTQLARILLVAMFVVLAASVVVDVAGAAPTDDAFAALERRVRVLEMAAGIPTPTPVATPTPSPSPSPSPTPVPPTPTPAPGGYFATLPVGAVLPSGAECATRVKPRPEQRPQNFTANHTVISPPLPTLLHVGTNAARVNGQFTGTTDEIIQWASCKWGLDEDMQRARAVKETNWRQDAIGDAGDSVCIFQVRRPWHPALEARASTAYCADYDGAYQRACFDGQFGWLGTGYRAGDSTICARSWFKGQDWRSAEATAYLNEVLNFKANKPWLASGF